VAEQQTVDSLECSASSTQQQQIKLDVTR